MTLRAIKNVSPASLVGAAVAIPAELQPGFSFAAALTSTTRQPQAASALLRFLAVPEAAPVISKAGLAPLN